MKLYLCGPINGRSDDDCKGWREQVKAEWPGECLDPMRRDYRGREQEPGIAAEIVNGDIEDIRECDALLVYFDKPSVGTSMEVLLAYQMGKPVVVVDASDKPLSPWLVYHATAVRTTIADALSTLAGSMNKQNTECGRSAGVKASEQSSVIVEAGMAAFDRIADSFIKSVQVRHTMRDEFMEALETEAQERGLTLGVEGTRNG